MKKNLRYIVIALFAICLVGFAVSRIAPAVEVHAAGVFTTSVSSPELPVQDATAKTNPTQPAVFVVTGLICIVFGILAVSSLLIDDPA